MDDERAPICLTCGVTMVPAALSGRDKRTGDSVGLDWVCLECEENGEDDRG